MRRRCLRILALLLYQIDDVTDLIQFLVQKTILEFLDLLALVIVELLQDFSLWVYQLKMLIIDGLDSQEERADRIKRSIP